MAHREFKDQLYAQFARVGKALASPQRLELLDLLAQGERTVEDLAREAALSIANASQHLRMLHQARLVESRKAGLYVYYRLADPTVFELWRALRTVGETQLAEIDRLVETYMHHPEHLEPLSRDDLLRRLSEGDAILLDVRPALEYQRGHIAGAHSIPVEQLEARLRELDPTREVVAYCRGPYCVFADEAVALLRTHGFTARRYREGYPEWASAGLPIEWGSYPKLTGEREGSDAMAVRRDPEEAETRAIHELLDFAGTDVLEVGCGDGRLTWRYAERARSVLALDPDAAAIAQARVSLTDLPEQWRHTVTFQVADITNEELPPAAFDVVVLASSLWCIAPEGVVNALHHMHTALRPGGQLLDLHPDAVHSPVEVEVGGAVVPLGHLDDTLHIRDVHSALAARQVVIEAGQFVLEREIRFTFITHFDSVESWLRFMAEHAQKSVIPAELAARASMLLPPASSGEVRIRRQTYAARLRRPGV